MADRLDIGAEVRRLLDGERIRAEVERALKAAEQKAPDDGPPSD